ncbi:MAG: hypothetical protein WC438_03335 [Candidatus Pacearchaeota archaeon]
MKNIDKNGFLEIKRKLLHIILGIIGLFLLIFNIVTPFIIFIILITGIFVSLLSIKFKIPIISFFLNNFDRHKDKIKLPGRGIIFAVAGSLLVLELFPRDIALASISILIFADPISHLIGRFLGKTKSLINNNKNIEGNIAGALVSSLIAMFFVPFCYAIAGALTAMLFELLVIKIQDIQLDDNLIIPLSAGTIMYLMQILI